MTTRATRYWKVLDAAGRSCHGGTLRWSLPRWTGRRWLPGRWMPRIDDIVPCARGYHLCRDDHLIQWLGDRIWRVELHPDAQVIEESDKVVTTGPVRLVAGTAWDEYTARLFAVSCAVDVLPEYERAYPGDLRVSDALVTAWEYAHGFVSIDQLVDANAAADAAARASWSAAARAASRAASRAAVRAASRAASRAAVRAASRAASRAAADAAASAAARAAVSAQTARLLRYLSGEVDV